MASLVVVDKEGKEVLNKIVQEKNIKQPTIESGLPTFTQDEFVDEIKNIGYDGIFLSEREGINSIKIFNKNKVDLTPISTFGKDFEFEQLSKENVYKPKDVSTSKKLKALKEQGYRVENMIVFFENSFFFLWFCL